jgi:uncharacterized membrane protein
VREDTADGEATRSPAEPEGSAVAPRSSNEPGQGSEASEDVDAAEVVPEELMEIAREVGPEAAKYMFRAAMSKTTTTWQWHVPPPEILAGYNQAYPGAARDLVDMAKTQSAHRQDLEKRVISSDIKTRDRGQLFGFILALVVLVGGLAAILAGKSLAGFSTVIVALVSLVSLFIYSRKQGKQELDEKMEALEATGGEDPFPLDDAVAIERTERDQREVDRLGNADEPPPGSAGGA